jgi:hypothetical protein
MFWFIFIKIGNKIFPVETECRFVFWFKVSADLLNTNGDDLFGIVYIPPEYTSYSLKKIV